MHPILRNVIAILAGAIIGGIVNGLIIMNSASIIPPPEGTDLTTYEGLVEAMHLMEVKHFIMPFLAHAMGTLIGGFIIGFLAVSRKKILVLILATFFFAGGLANILMLPSPMWFNVLDLTLGYFPMALLGLMIAEKLRKKA